MDKELVDIFMNYEDHFDLPISVALLLSQKLKYFCIGFQHLKHLFFENIKTERPDIIIRVVEAPKKRLLKRRLVQAPQAPIHSKCCIGGFRETGLALVIVLRCD